MAAVAFDTAKYVDNLEAVKMSHEQARAIVELVRSSHETADVATKGDIELLRKDLTGAEERLNAKVEGVEQRLNAKVEGVEQRLNAKVEGVEQRLNGKLINLEERLNGKMANLETGLRKDMEALGNKLIIRLSLAMLGMLGVIGTIVGLALRVILK